MSPKYPSERDCPPHTGTHPPDSRGVIILPADMDAMVKGVHQARGREILPMRDRAAERRVRIDRAHLEHLDVALVRAIEAVAEPVPQVLEIAQESQCRRVPVTKLLLREPRSSASRPSLRRDRMPAPQLPRERHPTVSRRAGKTSSNPQTLFRRSDTFSCLKLLSFQ